MDWLILLLLIPAIVVPVVLLWGFAGCGEPLAIDQEDSPVPGPPSELEAKVTGASTIQLTWRDNASGTWKFQIQRAEGAKGFEVIKDSHDPIPSPSQFFDDLNLKEGTTFFYAVNGRDPTGEMHPGPLFVGATTPPASPTALKAIPFADEIDLTWNNASATAQTFQITRPAFSSSIPVMAGVPQQFTVTGLLPTTSYQMSVRAAMFGYLNKEVVSDPAVTVSAITAKPVFSFGAFSAEEDLAGFCIVQRIGPSRLQNGGGKVSLKLRGPATGDLVLSTITISHGRATGVTNPTDSLGLIVTVATNVTVPRNGTIALGPVDFTLDKAQPFLVVFDVATNGFVRHGPYGLPADPGTQMYQKANTVQATVNIRAGYTARPNIALIEQIAVS